MPKLEQLGDHTAEIAQYKSRSVSVPRTMRFMGILPAFWIPIKDWVQNA